MFHYSAEHQHVVSLKKFFGPSQNDGVGGVLKPLFILTTALQLLEVLKSLNSLVNSLDMIFFLVSSWSAAKRATSILKQRENG